MLRKTQPIISVIFVVRTLPQQRHGDRHERVARRRDGVSFAWNVRPPLRGMVNFPLGSVMVNVPVLPLGSVAYKSVGVRYTIAGESDSTPATLPPFQKTIPVAFPRWTAEAVASFAMIDGGMKVRIDDAVALGMIA